MKPKLRLSLCEIRYQYLELCCLHAQTISMESFIYLSYIGMSIQAGFIYVG